MKFCVGQCAERFSVAGLRLLSLEKLAYKVDPWLAFGNLDFLSILIITNSSTWLMVCKLYKQHGFSYIPASLLTLEFWYVLSVSIKSLVCFSDGQNCSNSVMEELPASVCLQKERTLGSLHMISSGLCLMCLFCLLILLCILRLK